MQHVELRLVRQPRIRARRSRVLCEVLDRIRDLGDVVFDQELRAAICSVEQARRSDVSEVPYETASQQADQAQHVIVLVGFDNRSETLVYETVVVVLARGILAPEVVAQELVEVVCGGFPFFEAACVGDGLEEQVSRILLRPPCKESLEHWALAGSLQVAAIAA